MTDKQPEALRIADALDASEGNFYAESSLWYDKALSMTVDDAAAELRRLHALNAELVEALRPMLPVVNAVGFDSAKARAALSKAEAQQ